MNILITGGASGLGNALTKKATENLGDKVYFTYAHSVRQAKEIEDNYSNAVGIKCDFRNTTEIKDLTNKIAELDIDILVNNAYAGDFIKSHFQKTDPKDFEVAFKDNLLPTIIVTQAAINIFKKKKFGKIITILTSALVNTPPIGTSIYTANKAYLQQLSKAWATENAKFNITANTVSPGFMLTNFTRSVDDRVVEQILSSHPFKKLLTTVEVAETVYYLMKSSQQVNGIDMLLNAGASIR